MDYRSFEQQKKDYDNAVMHYLAKRIFDDIGDGDAYSNNIIDEVGNIVGDVSNKNDWAFSHLDKFILSLKNSLGEKYLRNLLEPYKWIKEIDSLSLINYDKNQDYENMRKNLGMIVTKIDDIGYLPNDLSHSDEYVEYEEGINFNNKVSRALTIATFLLYTLRNDRTPTEIDFNKNVVPSVEVTFQIKPMKDYNVCMSFCKGHKLLDGDRISSDGIRTIASIAEHLINGNVLSRKEKRVENQSNNWERIAKLNK